MNNFDEDAVESRPGRRPKSIANGASKPRKDARRVNAMNRSDLRQLERGQMKLIALRRERGLRVSDAVENLRRLQRRIELQEPAA